MLSFKNVSSTSLTWQFERMRSYVWKFKEENSILYFISQIHLHMSLPPKAILHNLKMLEIQRIQPKIYSNYFPVVINPVKIWRWRNLHVLSFSLQSQNRNLTSKFTISEENVMFDVNNLIQTKLYFWIKLCVPLSTLSRYIIQLVLCFKQNTPIKMSH